MPAAMIPTMTRLVTGSIHHAPVSGDHALGFVQDGRTGLVVERGVEQKQQFVSLHFVTSPGLKRPRDNEGKARGRK